MDNICHSWHVRSVSSEAIPCGRSGEFRREAHTDRYVGVTAVSVFNKSLCLSDRHGRAPEGASVQNADAFVIELRLFRTEVAFLCLHRGFSAKIYDQFDDDGDNDRISHAAFIG
jgi:hypothetical protein